MAWWDDLDKKIEKVRPKQEPIEQPQQEPESKTEAVTISINTPPPQEETYEDWFYPQSKTFTIKGSIPNPEGVKLPKMGNRETVRIEHAKFPFEATYDTPIPNAPPTTEAPAIFYHQKPVNKYMGCSVAEMWQQWIYYARAIDVHLAHAEYTPWGFGQTLTAKGYIAYKAMVYDQEWRDYVIPIYRLSVISGYAKAKQTQVVANIVLTKEQATTLKFASHKDFNLGFDMPIMEIVESLPKNLEYRRSY